jgi:peptidyl-prolyl cis-trans isomerase B (cyclophilin B)
VLVSGASQGLVRLGVFTAAAGTLLAGCSSAGTFASKAKEPTATATKGPTATAAPTGCAAPPTDIKNPNLSWPKEPAMTMDATKAYTMTLKTNCGDIVIRMDAAKVPHTVNSFAFLASKGFYNGSFCHRLATDSGLQMLQCGDASVGPVPKSTDGTGTPGYSFADENLAGAAYPAGTAAMANAGPNTNGSQFFLVYGDSGLGPLYTPFGTVTQGLDILQKIAAAGIAQPASSDGTGRPVQPVELESVTVS